MKLPELLAPVGDLDLTRTAYYYGADAVYAGKQRYSLRIRNNDFTMANLEIGIKEAHVRGKKLFLVSNISPHNTKVKTYMADMAPVIAMQPDVLIIIDPGSFKWCAKNSRKCHYICRARQYGQFFHS